MLCCFVDFFCFIFYSVLNVQHTFYELFSIYYCVLAHTHKIQSKCQMMKKIESGVCTSVQTKNKKNKRFDNFNQNDVEMKSKAKQAENPFEKFGRYCEEKSFKLTLLGILYSIGRINKKRKNKFWMKRRKKSNRFSKFSMKSEFQPRNWICIHEFLICLKWTD